MGHERVQYESLIHLYKRVTCGNPGVRLIALMRACAPRPDGDNEEGY